MAPSAHYQILLAERPEGIPTRDTFHFDRVSTGSPESGEVLLKTLYLSVDPYMRGRMNEGKSYIPPFELHEPIAGGGIGEVVESRSSSLKEGDIVIGNLNWEEFSIVPADSVRKIDPSLAPVSTHLGILGMPGLTAYFGVNDICRPKQGETVVVSGAAGAVGSAAGQIAKIYGARVVGIAGTDEKVRYLKEELHFDEVIQYNTTSNMAAALEKACPDGVDAYFDNVGGSISEALYPLLNKYARIAQCGAISTYNSTGEDVGPRVQQYLVKASALMQGFIVGDFSDRFQEGSEKLAEWLKQGSITYRENIVEGIQQTPDAFIGLFKGENLGKQIVKL